MQRALLGWCITSWFVLMGCQASVTQVAIPGERDAILLRCSWTSADACEYEAKQQCPDGYRVVASKPDQLTVVCRSRWSSSESAKAAAPAAGSDQGRVLSSATPGVQSGMTGTPPERVGGSKGASSRSERSGTLYNFSLGGGFTEMAMPRERGAAGEGSGWGFAGSAMIAKELFPGFALGGLMSFQQASTLKVSLWDTENSVSVGFLGPDVEALLCSLNCLRLGGALGLSALSAPDYSDVQKSISRQGTNSHTQVIPADPNSTSTSLAYDLHIAYELKVAPSWYVGLGFRLLRAGLGSDKTLVGYSFLADMMHD